jgi:hypothetical protein
MVYRNILCSYDVWGPDFNLRLGVIMQLSSRKAHTNDELVTHRRLFNISASTFRMIERALSWFTANIWVYVRILWRALVVCRASAAVVAVGWLLLASEQGQDVLLALAQGVGTDEGPFWHGYRLLIATLLSLSFWTISTWYWALTMLRFDLPRWTPSQCEGSRRKWATFLVCALPALIGIATVAAFYFNVAPNIRGISEIAKRGFLRLEMGASVVAALFVIYERCHRWLLDICEEDLRRQQIADIWGKTKGRFTGQSKGVIATWVLLVTSAIGIGMLIASWVSPVAVGRFFRTDFLFFVWAGSVIPLLSLLAYFTEHYRIPVMTILIGLAVLFSANNDNHVIRILDRNAASPSVRPSVEEAARDWFAASDVRSLDTVVARRRPLVLVATAGGGSRAAYWTATVLGRLQDCYPDFAQHTFAISGVSGGSLGAAAFRAVLTDFPAADTKNPGPPACGPHSAPPVAGGVAEKAQAVVGSDFLTATVAAFLYPDLLQRFWPWPIKSADRASIIELAWEDSYRRALAIPSGAGDGRFADSFIDAAKAPSRSPDTATRWPALFLNATWVETGRRLIISPFRLAGPLENTISAFPAADDLLAIIDRDIALSTAASLSARFTFVLPAGTLLDSGGRSHGRALDGGYFENYGAVTAAEVLREVRRALGPDAAWVRPIVILISSDPTLPNALGAVCNTSIGGGAPQPLSSVRCNVQGITYAPEIRSPVRAFSMTRQARGVLASLDLEALVTDMGGRFVHFRLCPATPIGNEEGTDPPLGWALSDHAKKLIDNHLTDLETQDSECRRINRDSWEVLNAEFGSTNRH